MNGSPPADYFGKRKPSSELVHWNCHNPSLLPSHYTVLETRRKPKLTMSWHTVKQLI